METLMEILIQLRAMQLYYHNSHNMVKGPLFISDHSLFGDFYPETEDDYDSVAERLIGLFNQSLDLNLILTKVYHKLPAIWMNVKENKDLFTIGLKMEQELQHLCNNIDKDLQSSAGLKQLTGDISDKSEQRCYKIKQRLK